MKKNEEKKVKHELKQEKESQRIEIEKSETYV